MEDGKGELELGGGGWEEGRSGPGPGWGGQPRLPLDPIPDLKALHEATQFCTGDWAGPDPSRAMEAAGASHVPLPRGDL